MNLQKWTKESQDKLEDLLSKEPNLNDIPLISSLMTILNYNSLEDVKEYITYQKENSSQNEPKKEQYDILPESNINEYIDELNNATVEFWKSSNNFDKKRTQESKDEMLNCLEDMLKEFEEVILEVRIKCQFPECLEIFQEFYKNLKNKI